MTRRYFGKIFATILIFPLIGGCVAEKYCDKALNHEWRLASGLRESLDGVLRRPTEKESRDLRTTIRSCKSIRTRFDIEAGPFNDGSKHTVTVILLAVELDDASVLDQLVAEGHPADGLPNSFGASTLYFATYRQAEESFFWALEQGVDPNIGDSDGITPLMIAAKHDQDHMQSVQALIAAGADANAVSSHGWTALATAINQRKFENAAHLVNAEADVIAAKRFLLDMANDTPNDLVATELREAVELFEEKLEQRIEE